MEEYGVTAYYYEESDDPDNDSPQAFHDSVPANSADEAAEWTDNHLRTELGVEPIGDIEVYPPGEDEARLYPT